MRTTLLAFALLASPAAAGDVSFPPEANGFVAFMMPSGNIGCLYVPEGGTETYLPRDGGPELICDRVEPAYAVIVLGRTGAPFLPEDTGEVSCCSGPVLEYGDTWSEGPFRCTSERTGLTCRREDGRGFSVARARIDLF